MVGVFVGVYGALPASVPIPDALGGGHGSAGSPVAGTAIDPDVDGRDLRGVNYRGEQVDSFIDSCSAVQGHESSWRTIFSWYEQRECEVTSVCSGTDEEMDSEGLIRGKGRPRTLLGLCSALASDMTEMWWADRMCR